MGDHMITKIGVSLFFINYFIQKVLRYNNKFPYLIHFTSRVRSPKNIMVSKNESNALFRCFAESPGVYIQAVNGVELHSCLNIAPGVKIISSNHNPGNLDEHLDASPIKIGKNVWLGANVVILPGVELGENVTIGAGSVVTKSIPSNSNAVGNPCKVIKNVCS